MSARVAPLHNVGPQPARVALLGLGAVGKAVLARLAGWRHGSLADRLVLVHAANSRRALNLRGGIPADACERLLHDTSQASTLDAAALALGASGTRIVLDATASEAVAERHAEWLAQGLHVVTACKVGQGGPLARWRAIRAACLRGGAGYGDSATVGAGLPLLRSLRELRAGGESIHAIAGVLSGSLGWLLREYDGLRPFSGFLRQARAAGYTEPDPREDLCGGDVRRKLLILARAAGFELEAGEVEVESLLPEALASARPDAVDAALASLDAPMRARHAYARKRGERLHYVARLQDGRARVGLESLPVDHPLAGGSGTDNKVAIWCDRYREQPLVIQGPGAGAEVTAAAMLDDALRLARLPQAG